MEKETKTMVDSYPINAYSSSCIIGGMYHVNSKEL